MERTEGRLESEEDESKSDRCRSGGSLGSGDTTGGCRGEREERVIMLHNKTHAHLDVADYLYNFT